MKRAQSSIHQYDVAIIGAGHNGLVCGALLAKAGKRVVLLEARQKIGGLSVTEEIAENVNGSVCAHLVYGLSKRVVSDLRLGKHGVSFVDGFSNTIALNEDGAHLTLTPNVEKTKENISRFSTNDANNYEKFEEQVAGFARVIATLLNEPAPSMDPSDSAGERQWHKVRQALKKLHVDQAAEFLHLLSSNVVDYLDGFFETDLLKGALAHDAIMGNAMGPRNPGSMWTYLYRRALELSSDPHFRGHPKGGVGVISDGLGKAALDAGADIRLGAEVTSLNLIDGRVAGVILEDGQTISAASVVSSLDPKKTFLELLPAGSTDLGFLTRIRQWRSNGTAAKLNFTLDGIPVFEGLSEQEVISSRLLVCPSTDYLEFAYNHTKYNQFSDFPALEIVLPTVLDPSLSTDGHQVMSVLVHYCPDDVEGGWDAARDVFVERVIRAIATFAPDITDMIVAGQVLTPADIAEDFGLTGGHWHHGDLSLDQSLLLRPEAGANDHETPISGLYLCGAGSHPGGGITGIPGHNAAQIVISRERGRR